MVIVSSAGYGFQQEGDYPDLPYRLVPDFLSLPTGWNFQEVPGVALNSRGHVFVFHRGPHALIEFDGEGKFIRTIGDGLFTRPHGLRIDGEDNIWTTDVGSHVVLKFSPDGRVLLVLGREDNAGETDRLFDRPADVGFGPAGEIFVADGYGNSRVVKFDKHGRFIKAWGKAGTMPGEFNLVHAIVVGANNRVYVGDRENERVQIFDLDGNFIEEWTHVGHPWGLHLTPDNVFYMADGYADRVLKLDLGGKVLGTLGGSGKAPGEFMYAHWIAVGPDEEFYVSEILNWRVQKFVRK
jgi:DNA-binding beta-propeller fold protein YncE